MTFSSDPNLKTINSLTDLCRYLGEDRIALLNHRLYKDTECGASLSVLVDRRGWIHNGSPEWAGLTGADVLVQFSIQTIVEGADAENITRVFSCPAPVEEVNRWIEEMEDEADALWREVNDIWRENDT